MEITVTRGAGDKPGDDLIKPLLSDQHAARERGRSELDKATTGHAVTLTTAPRPDWLPGAIVTVADSWQGKTYNGEIVSLDLSASIDDAGNLDVTGGCELWVPA